LPLVLGIEGKQADQGLVGLAVAGVPGGVPNPQSLELGSVLGVPGKRYDFFVCELAMVPVGTRVAVPKDLGKMPGVEP
jgi:hypothetical protein